MRRFCLVAAVSLLLPLLFCHSSFGIPVLETFEIETGFGTFNLAGQFTQTPGEPLDSLQFTLQTTIYDPNDPFAGVDIDATIFVDPDPEIVWFVSLYNFSSTNIMARSRVFTGNFTDAIGENSMVRSQIEASSSVTDVWGDGVTISPHNQNHFAVSELFNTTTSANMGIDIGDQFSRTGSGMIPPQASGWKPSPQGVLGPGEEWHGMRTYLNFSVTPLDAAVVIGRTQIQQVPEPSTLILFGVGILGMVVFYGWRKGRSQQ
jgi:hypothetical protein